MRLLTAAILSSLVCLTLPVASAGDWRLNPAQCPDLREDYRDSKLIYSRHDIRESYRDTRKVTCPASAWEYVPFHGEKVVRSLTYAGPTVVHVTPTAHHVVAPPYRAPKVRVVVR